MKDITVKNFNFANVKSWIEGYSHKDKVRFTVYCAELAVDFYTVSSDAPKKAIQAAKAWIESPTEENKKSCRNAAASASAYAAYAYAAYAAYDADADADADAAYAYAYAYAAYAASACACACADADAASASAYAAYAASACASAAKEGIEAKIIKWIADFNNQNPTKKTRTEYVKVEFEHAWEAVKAFEEGEELYIKKVGEIYWKINDAASVLHCYEFTNIYRKVEKEITWKDELKEALSVIGIDIGIDDGCIAFPECGFTDDEFLDMCKAFTKDSE